LIGICQLAEIANYLRYRGTCPHRQADPTLRRSQKKHIALALYAL
jgi:hypothetical protein